MGTQIQCPDILPFSAFLPEGLTIFSPHFNELGSEEPISAESPSEASSSGHHLRGSNEKSQLMMSTLTLVLDFSSEGSGSKKSSFSSSAEDVVQDPVHRGPKCSKPCACLVLFFYTYLWQSELVLINLTPIGVTLREK